MFQRVATVFLLSGVALAAPACRQTTLSSYYTRRSVQPLLPIDIDDLSTRVFARLNCEGREVVGRVDLIICPSYELSELPGVKGTLTVRFTEQRVSWARWQSGDVTDGDQLVASALTLREGVSKVSTGVIVSNLSDEADSWRESILRGEWHERLSLGNGMLVSYVAQEDLFATGETRPPEHHLVLQIQRQLAYTPEI